MTGQEWPDVVITLMHYYPRSQGARVLVTHRCGRKIVSSTSHQGMTVDDPSIQKFLAWARSYYAGAQFVEVPAGER